MRPTLPVLAALAAAALLACATRPRPVAPPPPSPAVAVRVERDAQDPDAWTVTYALPAPVRELRFTRPGQGYRQTHWEVLEPAGLRVTALAEDADALGSADGAPFTTVRLRVRAYAFKPPKDYQAFIPYSDGAVLLYTGVLSLQPADAAAPLPVRFTLVPRPGERVVAGGRTAAGPLAWEGAESGTYAYFGTQAPASAAATALVDPGLPPALRAHIEALFPRAVALYARRTGRPLTFTPALFISSGSTPGPRDLESNGGSLPGLIQLDVRLGAERRGDGDVEVLERISELVAHEAAHLWNGQLAHHDVVGGDWMHEGGAELFALRALAELGAATPERVRARLSDAASECLLEVAGTSLRERARKGAFTSHYRCGLVLFAVADARARPGADGFTAWGRVLREVGEGGTYDEARLYAALAAEGVPEDVLALFRRLVDGPTDGVEAELLAQLERAGFAPRASETEAPAPFQHQAAWRAVAAAVRKDCPGRLSFVPRREGVLVDGAQCATLGASPLVTHVAGRAVPADGLAAHAAVRAQCVGDARLEVRRREGAAALLPCTPPPARAAYVQLGRVPFLEARAAE